MLVYNIFFFVDEQMIVINLMNKVLHKIAYNNPTHTNNKTSINYLYHKLSYLDEVFDV